MHRPCRRSRSWLRVTLLGTITAGCVFTPQAIMLKPEVQVAPSVVGAGRTFLLTVVDERPKATLGTRGVRGMGAEITLQGDPQAVVQTSIGDGLRQQGFVPTADRQADGRELRVEIRTIDYGVTAGLFGGNLRTEAALKAVCVLGPLRPYERLYRGEVQETVVFEQGEDANVRYVNMALSKALSNLLSDPRLTQCLAQTP